MTPKTVFITGASGGIGRALALEYAKKGAQVALAARRLPELEAVAREVRGLGATANVYVLDVSDRDAVVDVVRRAEHDLGSLDMVIANAGVGGKDTLGHASTLEWSTVSRVINVNVLGALATLMAAVPIMMAQQRGHLVGVSSLAGKRGLPSFGAYSASKAALSAFLETLRIDLARAGIRVTDVQPGFVETSMLDRSVHPAPFAWTAEKAARVIVRRLERAPATIAFPWPLAALSSFSRSLPPWIYDPIARSAARRA